MDLIFGFVFVKNVVVGGKDVNVGFFGIKLGL